MNRTPDMCLAIPCIPVSDKYKACFHSVKQGERITFCDERSEVNSKITITAKEAGVYYSSPEQEIIPQEKNQKKSDYVIFCCTEIGQINFIELKGQNIDKSGDRDPFMQILDTIEYFSKTEGLKTLVSANVEKHVFIVSPMRQKIPMGSSISERKLLRKLISQHKASLNIKVLHYVKFVPKGKYSDNDNRIICSSNEPLEFPYRKL